MLSSVLKSGATLPLIQIRHHDVSSFIELKRDRWHISRLIVGEKKNPLLITEKLYF